VQKIFQQWLVGNREIYFENGVWRYTAGGLVEDKEFWQPQTQKHLPSESFIYEKKIYVRAYEVHWSKSNQHWVFFKDNNPNKQWKFLPDIFFDNLFIAGTAKQVLPTKLYDEWTSEQTQHSQQGSALLRSLP
jgi:hypothetical protein